MNEFDSARIGIKGDSNCDRCGMETDGNCCWDDVKVVKLQFQHTIASLLNADFSTPLAAPAYTDFTLGAIHQIISPTSKIAHSPPLIHGAIYIKNCVFRI
ncbi:MAG TPA: hypothetical protein VM368_06365 [Flavisolibacter sp.]|nr:hypothetical protein [Flavisolibacter sp.]